MYCPKCGQTQVADEVRFCSRCGFPLGGVAQLLAHGGAFPGYLPQSDARPVSPKRKGVRQGGTLMLFGAFLIPILALLCAMFGFQPEIILAGVVTLLAGIVRLLYAVIFEEGSAAPAPQPFPQPPAPPPFNPAARRDALPPRRHAPAPVSFRTRDTGELAGPPSVTENTTRLLDQSSERRDQ